MTTYRFTPATDRVAPRPRRVVVVDDHPLTRRGIIDTINDSTGWFVCAEAGTIGGALAVIESTHPDVVTVDLSLGHEDGLTLVAAIVARYPETRVLVVSVHDEEVFALRALRAGASGYLGKHLAPTDLLTALGEIAAGGTYLSEAAAAHVLMSLRQVGRSSLLSPIEQLTDRERQVLELVGHGLRTRDIGARLGLSVKTVETHYAHLKEKLDLPHSRALVRFAVEWVDSEWQGESRATMPPPADSLSISHGRESRWMPPRADDGAYGLNAGPRTDPIPSRVRR